MFSMLTMCRGPIRQFASRIEIKLIKQCSTESVVRKQDVFFDSEVQSLLKGLTGLNRKKIFRNRRQGQKIPVPEYQFVTDEELQKLRKESDEVAMKKLQMPPVMDERNPVGRQLENDEMLAGFDISKFVFTDITYGISDRQRLVVVRDPDGVLRTADWDEQDRMNQVYYPREERKHYTPQMFELEQLETLLENPDKYEYVLDRNCSQFEPDHPIYIRTAEFVYEHVNEHKNFSVLHSTRHYGPMVFYFCWTKQVDEFLVHQLIQKDLTGAANTVRLYQKINKDLSFNVTEDDMETMRNFTKTSGRRPEKIEMALQRLTTAVASHRAVAS